MFDYDPNKLGEKISTDGMNSVLHKYDDDNRYVVKRIVDFSEKREKQFTEEYMLGFNHNHPNILSYEGFSKRITNPIKKWYEICIKMKAMQKNLKQYVQEFKSRGDSKIPRGDIVRIFHSLAKALDHLQKRGIAHSNVVHDSVLFDANGIVKLAGFAFSRFQPWKYSGSRIYQSYTTPEKSGLQPNVPNIDGQMTIEERRRRIREAKELAFKADVWCLGKLIIDICLLRDQGGKGKGQKAPEILKKTGDDIAEVEKKYCEDQDKALISVLKPLLRPDPQGRPNFTMICSSLELLFSDEVK